jgi:hypothetical protein
MNATTRFPDLLAESGVASAMNSAGWHSRRPKDILDVMSENTAFTIWSRLQIEPSP